MNKYLITAFLIITLVGGYYYYHFGYSLHYEISDAPETWGQLGDYLGGLLNPILTFITLCLLIKTIELQNHANSEITKDIKNRDKTEQLRSFENLFFNLLKAHTDAFRGFEIEVQHNKKKSTKRNSQAVDHIEKHIELIRREDPDDENAIKAIINDYDKNDDIYNIIRVFANIIKTISSRLENPSTFTCSERKSYMEHLINNTNFSHYRLLLIAIQFLDYPPTEYLKNHNEFISLLKDLEADISSY